MVDTNDKMFVEQIIDTVKQHPVLYDSTLPCRRYLRQRQALWEEIADTFDVEVQHLKTKWKNLRDCYIKHIRAQNDETNTTSSLKYWHWSKYLEFLRPHIRSNPEVVLSVQTDDDRNAKEHAEKIQNNIRLEEIDHTNFGSDFEAAQCTSKQTRRLQGKHSTSKFGSDSDPLVHSNTELVLSFQTDDDHNSKEHSENIQNIKLEEIDHTNFESDFDTAECISKPTKILHGKLSTNNFGSDSDSFEHVIEQPNRKKKRMITTQNVNNVDSQSNRDVHGFDDIELIFLGYAKTVKKMPLKKQITVKMKIAKIMMDEELKCLE